MRPRIAPDGSGNARGIGQAEQSAPPSTPAYLRVNVKLAVILASSPPRSRRSSGFSFGSTLELTLLGRMKHSTRGRDEKERERKSEKKKKKIVI